MLRAATVSGHPRGVADNSNALCINEGATVQVVWSVSFVEYRSAFLLSKQRDQLCGQDCHAESYSRLASRSVQGLCLSHTHTS